VSLLTAQACDVLQTMHALTSLSGLVSSGYIDCLEQLAIILATAAHDLQHKGLTNDYLITTEDELAILYSDRSPSEHHHLASLFTLLKNPELNILSHLPYPLRRRLRQVCGCTCPAAEGTLPHTVCCCAAGCH
jgi:cAMP-specific phosphodiesterase 4